jgi:hypothetical protein
MAKRRTYKRDRRGRFASTGSTRVKRVRRKINRRRPRYVRGSLGKTLRVGRVGPGAITRAYTSALSCARSVAASTTSAFRRPQNCDAVLALLAHQLGRVAEGFEPYPCVLVSSRKPV